MTQQQEVIATWRIGGRRDESAKLAVRKKKNYILEGVNISYMVYDIF